MTEEAKKEAPVIGADPKRELEQLELEAGAGEIKNTDAPQGDQTGGGKDPEGVPTAAMIQPLVMVAAQSIAPNWELHKPCDALGGETGVNYLTESYAATIDHYFPDFAGGNFPPWALPLIATGTIISLNAHIKPKDDPEPEAEPGAPKEPEVIGTPESRAKAKKEKEGDQ